MERFSVQDAALAGFAAVRHHPLALAAWTPLAFLLSLALQAIELRVGPQNLDWSIFKQDPAALSAELGRLVPAELLIGAVGMVANAFVQAAIIRLQFRPAQGRFGFLRAGPDELRQLGLQLCYTAVICGICIAATMLLSFLVAAFAVAGQALVVPATVAGLAVVGVIVVVVGVRLSLAPAATFSSGRIDLFGSWALTRGLFWPILGTYALTGALVVVVYALSMVLIEGLGGVALGPEMAVIVQPAATPAQLFEPLRIIMALFDAFVTALLWPVFISPPVVIYARLSAPPVRPSGGIWG
jgi:hypothetical protein